MSTEIGFFDYLERVEQLAAKPTALDQLNQCIDWSRFESVLKSNLNYKERSKGGRRPYAVLLMFKVLILQKYYNLSEEDTEFQILDRFSFQRFLGLSVSDKVPDKNTIWLFKQRLGEDGIKALFDHFSTVLRAQGLSVNEGKLAGQTCSSAPKRCGCSLDHKVRTSLLWLQEPHKSRRIHQADRTTAAANSHDSTAMNDLVDASDQRLYADSAYNSFLMLNWLKNGKGVDPQINERAYRNRPLSDEQKQNNRIKSKTRARVEHVFAFFVNSMKRADHIRCIGLSRARQNIGLGNLIYNLFRFKQLGGTMLA